ncbi:MAG: DUF134 domain-containing protein [Nanoarchaeota archaeon]|nr:DUF134 domain-containing protein [Nanoarchaeota archaeon]
MPRPRRCRRIFFKPELTCFRPRGFAGNEEVILSFEEIEAIRLIDLEKQSQSEAGEKMKISQPTLSRLLSSAREKLAEAIVNSKMIKIKGGEFKMVIPRRGLKNRGRMGGFALGPGGICKCPKCGYEEPQIRGQPCVNKKCPKCNSLMVRK